MDISRIYNEGEEAVAPCVRFDNNLTERGLQYGQSAAKSFWLLQLFGQCGGLLLLAWILLHYPQERHQHLGCLE
ncbi:MAG: hypothetical protein EAZ92_01410 [Candidatus Kapaibacterium sp.]|nr:MAG: hypothetical protein EAZ92_01410 [Candidatus Kapabacteria bacterium]